jgi:hypothetical protein
VAEGGTDPVRIPVRDFDGTLVGYQRDPSDQMVATLRSVIRPAPSDGSSPGSSGVRRPRRRRRRTSRALGFRSLSRQSSSSCTRQPGGAPRSPCWL